VDFPIGPLFWRLGKTQGLINSSQFIQGEEFLLIPPEGRALFPFQTLFYQVIPFKLGLKGGGPFFKEGFKISKFF